MPDKGRIAPRYHLFCGRGRLLAL